MTIPEAQFSMSGNEVIAIVDSFLESLLWSEGEICDENGDATLVSWDEKYDEADATPELRAAITAEVNALDDMSLGDEAEQRICNAAHEYIRLMGTEQFGHDMALTRNGHGAGFWDRGLGEVGDVLTEWAKGLGTLNVFDTFIPECADKWAGMFHAE